jgi:tetratricopeptide (TPR) repeat protein
MSFSTKSFFLPWAMLVFLPASCARPGLGPKYDPGAVQASKLQQQGDVEFAKMHWRGWENAAAFYEEALAASDEAELRQKLITACILLSLRETELSFPNGSWIKKAEELLPHVQAEPNSTYLALAREKLRHLTLSRGVPVAPGVPELGKNTWPRESGSALSHYLYVQFLQLVSDRDTIERYIAEENEFRRLHGNSNLAVFLRSWTPEEMDEKLAAFPDFAEMYKLRGDWRNSGKKYRAALADYQRAMEAMPVLFKASNAMGTLWYSLEEYEQAQLQYGRTLEIVPLEPTALFGRAICLSELRRYEESDQALREMIEKQTLYHGEANYYLAKNSYYRQRWTETRSYLDLAAAYIPDSPEMNMLSGLLYLDQGQTGKAELDFRKVLEQQPQHAEAWYFLGQAAYQEKKTREARQNFQAAIENFRRELANFDARLAKLKSEAGTDLYQQNYFMRLRRLRSAYTRQAFGRLTLLQKIFKKPLLSGLRELLADLAAAPPDQ